MLQHVNERDIDLYIDAYLRIKEPLSFLITFFDTFDVSFYTQ